MTKATAKVRHSSQEIFIGPGIFKRTSHRAEIRPAANLGIPAGGRNAAPEPFFQAAPLIFFDSLSVWTSVRISKSSSQVPKPPGNTTIAAAR